VFLLWIACIARGGDLWISEILFNPPGSNSVPDQYIELRGTPNLLLTNIYFVSVEGDINGNPGLIQNIFDLTGRRIGGNGFLVLLQNSNHYIANPAATVLVNTNGAGFGSSGSSSIGHRGRNGQEFLEPASETFFLIQTSTPFSLGDDIDSDDDGLPDGAVFASWAVLDSVGVLDSTGAGDIAYGQINFRRADAPGNGATALTGQIVPVPFTPRYVARFKNSTGWAASNWVAAANLGRAAPFWTLDAQMTFPPALARRVLNHVGGPNFGAPRLPGVLLRDRGSGTVKEGSATDTYTLALNAPARGTVSVAIAAPPGLEVSTDHGHTFGSSRIVPLRTLAPRTITVRATPDDVVTPPAILTLTHTVISSADPAQYPTNGTIVPPLDILRVDDDRVLLSEIKANPPGTNDAPFEFVELRGTPGALLTNLYFVGINGDDELNAGVATTVISLDGQRLGTNGLLLIVSADAPYVPAPGTTVFAAPQFDRAGGALDNGTVSFLLVYSTNGIVEGSDLDAGDNGVAEKLPADAVVLDSIAWYDTDGGGNDLVYTPAVLAFSGTTPDAATRFGTNDTANSALAWFGGNLSGTNADSLSYDEKHVTTNFPSSTALSPGVTNRTAPQISMPHAFSSVIGDPTTPPIRFTVSNPDSPLTPLAVTVQSSDTNVVPDENLILTGKGSHRTLVIKPQSVGYSIITVSATDGQVTGTHLLHYAASEDLHGGGVFHTGASDGSTGYAIDARWLLIGDDENQTIRMYSRSNSGPPIAMFDMNPFLGLTDLYADGTPKEVDIEASTHVGNRIYWMGSHSHSGDFQIRTNRARVFTTDITGTGTNSRLTYVGRYDYLKADMVNWDAHGEHGKGDFYYGLLDSSQPGVDPKATNGSGFNIEGLAMAPFDTNTAYIGMRAPLVPPTNRIHALIMTVTNFAALATSTGPPGSAAFGAPIELNLGGRGIRSIEGTGTNYLIVAGPPGPASGIPPSDFKLFTWTGRPADPPLQRSTDLTGLNPEGIVDLPRLPWTSNSVVQLISDNGAVDFYNDGQEAKHLSIAEFKKCRTDWVKLGSIVTPQPLIRTAISAASNTLQITWHSFAGIKYRVQAKAELSDPAWQDVSGTVTATGSTTSAPVQASDTERFFRIVVVE